MSTYTDNLEWRYATKKFDADKKVSQEDLDTILKAAQLSASSYGLQPYHIFIVENTEIRKQLQPVSWGQSQIIDASHLLVIANKTTIDDVWIDAYFNNVSETRDTPLEAMAHYIGFMKSKILPLSAQEKAIWASKQTYIALSNIMSAAADLNIDTCPMEGFDPEAYDTILNLKEKGLTACLAIPIGYRSVDDATQHYKKVRLPKNELFTHI